MTSAEDGELVEAENVASVRFRYDQELRTERVAYRERKRSNTLILTHCQPRKELRQSILRSLEFKRGAHPPKCSLC